MEFLFTHLVAKYNFWLYIVLMMIGLYAMIAKNNLIKKFNLENEKLLANDLGRNIRRAYWLITQLVIRVSQKRIAETALYVTLRQRKRKAKKYREILKNIKPNTQLYNLMNKLNEIIQQLKDETAVLKVANDET